ncbi:nickel-dependent hydrogenase large subunit [Sulfuriflexus mobilis]|uniref:nickel-dependent hydrogenase large subunit n=1 Tax=Sulfuriflexus mobilis TaxID=1811807 RepID=UPI000F81600A|nr:nickel-dependent hydrogenase large subunit [Sulfuriflexus mobilis]
MTERKEIRINVPALARVEGEGALGLVIRDGAIQDLQLRIYEPPRYFEKFLEGRDYTEVCDIVARICGICPVAYQMSAVQALEDIVGFEAPAWLSALRRVMYCGEWIQSHSLHIHMLAAPDFLGFNSIIEMGKTYPDEVRRGLMLQGLGNDLISLLGARSVHPIGIKVGGLHHLPSAQARQVMRERLIAALPEAEALLRWTASLALPDDEQDFVSVALRHATDYPIDGGRLVSSDGLDIPIEEFEQHVEEQHVPHSTALHALLHGQPYLVGPLARLNLNRDRLPPMLRELLDETGISFPSRNMFHSIVARAAEIWLAIFEAARLLEVEFDTQQACPTPAPRAGTGFGCTEAPRGILWHRYAMNARGQVGAARIVPPTSQNQSRIEQDLHNALNRFGLDKAEEAIRLHAEMVIRNYDPCISCATHFLKLDMQRDSIQETSAPQTSWQRVVVLGIGTAQTADDVGLRLLEQLQQDTVLAPYLADRLALYTTGQPALDWQRYIRSGDRVFVIDALLADVMPDRLVVFDGAALAPATGTLSSHAIGLRDALLLSPLWGQETNAVTVLGIRVGVEGEQPPDTDELQQLAEQVRERVLTDLLPMIKG